MTESTKKHIRNQAGKLLRIRERERIAATPKPRPEEDAIRSALAGMIYGEISELARLVQHSRAYLHDVKNGRRNVSESLARKLAELP